MITILIVLLLVIGVVLATSVALGRSAYEVESVRDTEYLELEGNWIRYNVIGGGPPVLMPISRRCRPTSRPASALPILFGVHGLP